MEGIIELLDKADIIIREKLKESKNTLIERYALRVARELIQKAITILLDIH